MRLRLVVVTRAVARTSSGTPAWALPSSDRASAWKRTRAPLEAQPSVLMPAITPAGHSGCVLRRVCTSPLGSE